MPNRIIILSGVAKTHFGDAARLYCEAFEQKIRPFLGPPERAAAFLEPCLVSNRAFVALAGDDVVGIAGYKLAGTDLFKTPLRRFFNEYGWTAPIRVMGLALLARLEAADCLLMDGIAVAERARGKGVGTKLLAAIEAHARSLGKKSVRLDVIDTNAAARRLYERLGYTAVETTDIGLLRLVFPFRKTTEMRKYLQD